MIELKEYKKIYEDELVYLQQYERETGRAVENAADTIAKYRCYQRELIERIDELADMFGLSKDKPVPRLLEEIKAQIKTLKTEVENLNAVLVGIEAESQWLR